MIFFFLVIEKFMIILLEDAEEGRRSHGNFGRGCIIG